MNPRIRARRIFKGNDRFVFLEEVEDSIPITLVDEKPICLYRENGQTILITDTAMHVHTNDNTNRIEFSRISEIKGPSDKSAHSISIIETNGSEHFVTIVGGDGRFKDIFSFVRFLDRVNADMNSDKMH